MSSDPPQQPPAPPNPPSNLWASGPPAEIQKKLVENKERQHQHQLQQQYQQHQQVPYPPGGQQGQLHQHQRTQDRAPHNDQRSQHPGARGGGRGGGRGPSSQQGRYGGRGDGRGRGGRGPVAIAPTTGIPYGHVPAYLPGSASLVEQLDQKILMVLRDGRHLVGTLRSFDQFSNLVLEETSERRIHKHDDGKTYYNDIPLGIYVVRGEALVLMGEVSDAQHPMMVSATQVEFDEIVEKCKTPAEKLDWNVDMDLLA